MPAEQSSYLCDVEMDTTQRMRVLSYVFDDIFEVTMGRFTQKDIIGAKKILDLGMGRGSVGGYSRGANPEVKLIGIDTVEYQGEDLYHLYDKRIIADLTQPQICEGLKGVDDVDLAIGVGLPPHVVTHLANNIGKIASSLGPGGIYLLVSDFFYKPEEVAAFTSYGGNLYIDNTILLLRGK